MSAGVYNVDHEVRIARVKNVAWSVSEPRLRSIFSSFGEIESIIIEPRPGLVKEAKVVFKDSLGGEFAQIMNGATIDGKRLVVSLEKEWLRAYSVASQKPANLKKAEDIVKDMESQGILFDEGSMRKVKFLDSKYELISKSSPLLASLVQDIYDGSVSSHGFTNPYLGPKEPLHIRHVVIFEIHPEATEGDVSELFHFVGAIESMEMHRLHRFAEAAQIALVTFVEEDAAEIASCLNVEIRHKLVHVWKPQLWFPVPIVVEREGREREGGMSLLVKVGAVIGVAWALMKGLRSLKSPR